MLEKSVDRIGDWNPQLFKELKIRLTSSTAMAVAAIAILAQFIGIGLLIASPNTPFDLQINRIFSGLNWMIPNSLILGSIYAIRSDLDREEKLGTLDAIRLTPQSARRIFIGKMLGVPSLIYLTIGLMVPIHFVVGILAKASLLTILAWYLTVGATAYLCFSLTILYSLHGGKYTLLYALSLSMPVNSFVGFYNYFLTSAITEQSATIGDRALLSWFYLPIVNNTLLFYSFMMFTLLGISHWLWVTIERRYTNLALTAISKADSYWLNIQFQLWLLGFALPILNQIGNSSQTYVDRFYVLAVFYTIGVAWIFFTMPLILPNRQSTQEWSRARRELVNHEHRQWWQQEIVRDLLWHDRSPILLAILVNLLILAIGWGLCFGIFIHDLELLVKSSCGIIIASILTLIHTVIINFIYLRSRAKRAGSVLPLTILISWAPLWMGLVIVSNPDLRSWGFNLLLFSPFAWIGVTKLSLLNIGAIALCQLGMLAWLTKLMQRRLQQLGESGTKILDRKSSSLTGSNI